MAPALTATVAARFALSCTLVAPRRSDEAGGRGVQGGLDRQGQGPGRFRRELDRDARRRARPRVEEVDVEGVLGLRVHRVVEVDARVGHLEPAGRALPAPADLDLDRKSVV